MGVAITAYLVRRLRHSLLVLVGVLAIVFVLGRGIADPARIMRAPDAPQDRVISPSAEPGTFG